MSTDYDPSIAEQAKTAMDRLLTDRARAWVAYEGEYRAHAATKAALAAAEKRAEEAEALALRTGNALRALSRQVEAEISRGALFLPDHACAECLPAGESLIPGFRCARHNALLSDPAGRGEVAPTQPQESR